LNCFGVNASQPLAVWRKKGGIYEEEPRGWFQHCARRDLACRPRQRQALLHWAYDSRKL